MPTIREVFVQDPPSQEICARLDAAAADVCEHERAPCIMRCGVRLNYLTLRWEPIPKAERLAWLERREADASH